MEDPSSALEVVGRQPPPDIDTTLEVQRLQLEFEIYTIIGPYRGYVPSPIKPPFSVAELIVIALVCCKRENSWATSMEIIQWIIMMFPFFLSHTVAAYADKAFDLNLPERQARLREPSNIAMIIEGFWEALGGYEIPLIVCRVGEGDQAKVVYTVKMSEARVFLRNILEPPRLGVFRFLDLPAELRVYVHENLLLFSGEDGLTIVPKMHGSSHLNNEDFLFLLSQRVNGSPCHTSPDYERIDEITLLRYNKQPIGIYAPPMESHLAILSVCRQICDEAVPIFYGQNHFRFHSMASVDFFFIDGPSARTEHLGKISITLDPPGHMEWVLGMFVEALPYSTKLKELNIGMHHEQLWLQADPYVREELGWKLKRKFKTFDDIPPMLDLAEDVVKIQGFDAEQHIQGNCPLFKAFMKEQLEVLRAPGDGSPESKRAQAKKEKAKEARAKKKAASEATTGGS